VKTLQRRRDRPRTGGAVPHRIGLRQRNPPIRLTATWRRGVSGQRGQVVRCRKLRIAAQRRRFEAVASSLQRISQRKRGCPLSRRSCASCHEQPGRRLAAGTTTPEEGSEDVELHATAFHGAGAPLRRSRCRRRPGDTETAQARLERVPHLTSEPIPAAGTDSVTARRPTYRIRNCSTRCRTRSSERRGSTPTATGGWHFPVFQPDGGLGRLGRFAASAAATLRRVQCGRFCHGAWDHQPVNQTEQTSGTSLPAGIDPCPTRDRRRQLDAADAFVRFLRPHLACRSTLLPAIGADFRGSARLMPLPGARDGANLGAAPAIPGRAAFTDRADDYGARLADICSGGQPSESGLSRDGIAFATVLHDGRADLRSPSDQLHGGEGQPARQPIHAA